MKRSTTVHVSKLYTGWSSKSFQYQLPDIGCSRKRTLCEQTVFMISEQHHNTSLLKNCTNTCYSNICHFLFPWQNIQWICKQSRNDPVQLLIKMFFQDCLFPYHLEKWFSNWWVKLPGPFKWREWSKDRNMTPGALSLTRVKWGCFNLL